ncbi:ferredoxin--NADP reductase, partial [Acinetobacter baumannii]
QLQHLKVGDELYLEKIPYGYLTLARYQQPLPHDLWLLATGTGLAPFLSMLQDFETWSNYQKINLVYSVRTAAELAYVDRIQEIAETF